MPRFPSEESKIIELAQKVVNGIIDNASELPNPPAAPAAVLANVAAYSSKNNDIQLAKARVTGEIEEKNEILERIIDATRDNIDYVVLMAKGNQAMLESIGWGNRAAPTALQPPGQCRALELISQNGSSVKLDWKEPADGGKPAAYKIQRSEGNGDVADAGIAVDSICELSNQPTGKRLTYQVVAINKAGEGMASNTVSLVL